MKKLSRVDISCHKSKLFFGRQMKMKTTIVLIFLFSILSLCQGIVNNTIVIGMSISLTPPSSARAQLGIRVNDGMTFYLETVSPVTPTETYEIDRLTAPL